jgi:ADP-heptose:LPS heptosyltransferase
VVNDREVGSNNAVDRYWKVAELFGVGHLPKEFPIAVSTHERQWARERLTDLARPIIAVHPGARWPTKRWPPSRFAEVLSQSLAAQAGSAVILGGPGEEGAALEVERQWHDCQATLPGNHSPRECRNLAGRMSLRELAAVLAESDLLLTNDSGPMHLAAAVGTPTVSIFTCTSPQRAAPYGRGHRHVQTNVPCRASYLKECPSMVCMADLTTDRVVPVVCQSLADWRVGRPASPRAEPLPDTDHRAA